MRGSKARLGRRKKIVRKLDVNSFLERKKRLEMER